jgi:D-glycero-alpha-D-manno-heptose-7-phosphate kinase
MLLARAPVRISLAGGGTDLEAYYARYGGMVVSAAINKYFYVFVSPSTGEGVHISSSDYRSFCRWSREEEPVWDGDLRLPRAILHEFSVRDGLSVFLASEIPPGTGLGSSSTVAVALVKALATLCGQRLTAGDIAELAARIEIEKLGSPIGKQDHYAASFGGLNAIFFEEDGTRVEPLALDLEVRGELEKRLLLFFTNSSRSANAILREQRDATASGNVDVLHALHEIKKAAVECRAALERGDLPRLGELLHEAWQHKKRLAGSINNTRIDELYERARRAGATGGKITGAGGGGFLLLYCEPPYQPVLCAEMEALGLYRMDFHFDSGGAKVLMNSSPQAVGSQLVAV